jgi:hypothetical protein
MMASTNSMDENDGGLRRVIQKIINKGVFTTCDLFYIKQLTGFDINHTLRYDKISNHFYFTVKGIFMYFNIHFTKTLDNKTVPFVTDFYTLLLTKKIAKEYEKRFKMKIKTDTIKRTRQATRLITLLRVIQKKFCYKKSKYYKVKNTIDPFIFYREIQSEAYSNTQDLVFAINILNDEFYDRIFNQFMLNIIKLYRLDKLSDKNGNIFDNHDNIIKFYNHQKNNNIYFLKEFNPHTKTTSLVLDYIVIDTKQPRWQFELRMSQNTGIPPTEIKKIFKKLKTNIFDTSFEKIQIQQCDNSNIPSSRNRSIIRRDNISLSDIKYIKGANGAPLKIQQYSFKECGNQNNFKMEFHISHFKNMKNYSKNQFEIFKEIILSLITHDHTKIKKLMVINDTKNKFSDNDYEILNIEKRIKKQTDKYNYLWEKAKSDTRFKKKIRSLTNKNDKNKLILETDEKIRERVGGIKRGITISNLINVDHCQLITDDLGSQNGNDEIRKLLKKKKFFITKDIGLLNKELHEKIVLHKTS